MESLNPELALYVSKNECTRTNTVLPPISELSTRAVSLVRPHVSLAYLHGWAKFRNFLHSIMLPPTEISWKTGQSKDDL